MKTICRTFLVALLPAIFLQMPQAWAVTLGQIDTFEDGTIQNWIGGLGMGGPNPAAPVNALGGPTGASDNFLLLSAIGGAGPGARLSVLNLAQWSGNYIAAGVGSIAMDLRNFGSTDLALRLVFEDPTVGPPTNLAFSTNAFILPAGAGWTHAVFPIGVSDLQAGLGTVNTALMNTTAIRIYHSVAPTFPNPVFPIAPVVAQLGVDNIQAGARVPEGSLPAIFLLSPLLIAGYFCRRVRESIQGA